MSTPAINEGSTPRRSTPRSRSRTRGRGRIESLLTLDGRPIDLARDGPTGGIDRIRRRALRRLTSSIPPHAGGCEGLAMLNRTNRTLSANLNRLNLGTRSLALAASVNNGDSTLRIRHVHPCRHARRDGRSIRRSRFDCRGSAIPSIPGSPSVSSWLVASSAVRPSGRFSPDGPLRVESQVRSRRPASPARRQGQPQARPPQERAAIVATLYG